MAEKKAAKVDGDTDTFLIGKKSASTWVGKEEEREGGLVNGQDKYGKSDGRPRAVVRW